jgi:mono/diheme cytochrome c family protein
MKWCGALAFLVCLAAHGQPAHQPGEPLTNSMGALLPRDGVDAAVFRGGLVFSNYCVTCHGMNADGNGRAARLYNPRPANLRVSDKNDAYILSIIRMGGPAMGRSEFMPPWGAELTEEQMNDLTGYLRSIITASRR